MIIDLILDRRAGDAYGDGDFYTEVADYCEVWPDLMYIIAAMDTKVEQIVKYALCRYVIEGGYNPEICDYINSVNWLYKA